MTVRFIFSPGLLLLPLHSQLREGSQWRPQRPEQAWPRPGSQNTRLSTRSWCGRATSAGLRERGLAFSPLSGGVPGGSLIKNLPAMQETQVRFLGREHTLEKGMANYFRILAWEIPCRPWGHKESDTTERGVSLGCQIQHIEAQEAL